LIFPDLINSSSPDAAHAAHLLSCTVKRNDKREIEEEMNEWIWEKERKKTKKERG
jgi:hypothetical protein